MRASQNTGPKNSQHHSPGVTGKAAASSWRKPGRRLFFILRLVPFSEPFDGRIRMHVMDHHRLPGSAPERHAIAPALKATGPTPLRPAC